MRVTARVRLAQAITVGGVVVLASAVVMSRLDWSAGAPPETSTAPLLTSTPDLVSRAWFVSRKVGWIVVQLPTGGLPRMELRRTADAGVTWQPQVTWDGAVGPEVARFFSSTEAIVVARLGSGLQRIFTTTDGSTWRTGGSPSSSAAVSFIDANRGWATYPHGAELAVDRTADGGRTWERLTTFVPHSWPSLLQWVEFIDTKSGLIGGMAEGTLAPMYTTHDGGVTWAAVTLPGPPEPIVAGGSSVLSDASVLGGGAVALKLSVYPREGRVYARSYMYMSGDSGRSWSRPRPLPGTQWRAFDQLHVIATYGQTLFASRDGGRTWRRIDAQLPTPRPELPTPQAGAGAAFNPFRFAAPAFLDDKAGWATLVTTQQCQGGARPQACIEHPHIVWAIAKTSDGGSSWTVADGNA